MALAHCPAPRNHNLLKDHDMVDPVAQKIESHGWAVVKVAEDQSLPAYAYSVGLFERFGHPEVIAFGLDADKLQDIINGVGREVKAGAQFAHGVTSDAILHGYKCAFRAVDPAAERSYMGAAIRYYGKEVPAVHCIWPDREGRFPWDAGANSDYRRLQPMLGGGPERSTSERPTTSSS